MPHRPNLPDLPGILLQMTGLVTESAISSVRNFLYDSLTWLGQQTETISDHPVIHNMQMAHQLKKTGESLREAGTMSFEAVYTGIHRAAESLTGTLHALNILDRNTFESLGTNIAPQSILGDSFTGSGDPLDSFRPINSIEARTSFRLNGADATSEEIVKEFRASGLSRAILCIPGLFQDESLWQAGRPRTLAALFRGAGYFPIFLRFDPGQHIPRLGRDLADCLESLAAETTPVPLSIVSFSHGGLIARSALIQGRASQMAFPQMIEKAILISSPDGGYYIEKTGFLFGFGFGDVPDRALKFMNFAGNRYTPAFRDLASAILREEDLNRSGPVFPLSADRYYGELDGISSYQIFSLIADSNHLWSQWLGDGLIEGPSLTLLSETPFRSQASPDERVHCLIGLSHFQILQSEELSRLLETILTG